MNKTEANEDLEQKQQNVGNQQENISAAQGAEEETSDKQPAVEGGEPDAAADNLREELESAKDKYIRLYSEFENFRKRTAREKLELIQSANEQLIKALLPVVDDFERAENAVPDKEDKYLEGFLLIQSKFRKVLELYGVKPMDAAQGSDFSPDFHEAVSQIQAPVPELKGKIVDVVEQGYFLNDKVIRYAKVVVGN